METPQGYIQIDAGVRLFYETSGSNDGGSTPLVVLNAIFMLDDFKYLSRGRRLIGIDLRNRGRSDFITDASKLRGVEQDVDDIEVVRHHFDVDKIDLIAHSYAGVIPILYAIKYPDHVRRIVQIGAVQPNQATKYSSELMNADGVLHQFFANAQELQKQWQSLEPQEFCRKFWTILRPIYVANPADADKLERLARCDLETELNLMSYWTAVLQPSLNRLQFTTETVAHMKSPVLVVHGTKDRSSPYGAGRDWAKLLPDARLLTVQNVAHMPWIEAPEQVLPAIEAFLDGAWPNEAEAL
jgi:proline iminopeptidase